MSKWVDVSWVSQRQVGLLGNNFPSYLPPQNLFPEYVFLAPLTYFDKGLPHAKFPSKMPDKSPPFPLLTFHCNSTFKKKSKYEGCLKSMPRQYTSEMNNKELFWHTWS